MNAHSQTPDQKLRASIIALFAKDDRMASAGLRVGVKNGIVHLAGVVSSIETRILAGKLAEEVTGVRGVVNRIEAPGAPSPGRTINLNIKNQEGNPDE